MNSKMSQKQSLPKRAAPKAQTFSQHLQELRTRVVWYLSSLFAGTIVGYFFYDQILAALIRPLGQPIFYTSPSGGFNFTVQLSLFVGFILSLPMLVYQLVAFLEPAFSRRPRYLIMLCVSASILLLALGVVFAYWISLPGALYFLNAFASPEMRALISTEEYFSFITRYLLGFGLIFQLPLVILAIHLVRPFSFVELWQYQRWVVLGSFLFSAILTPTPDVFNQILMALPLIVLYQVSIVIIWVYQRLVSRKHSAGS